MVSILCHNSLLVFKILFSYWMDFHIETHAMVLLTDDSLYFLDQVEKVIVKQKTLSMLKSFVKLKLFLKRFPSLIQILQFLLNFPAGHKIP